MLVAIIRIVCTYLLFPYIFTTIFAIASISVTCVPAITSISIITCISAVTSASSSLPLLQNLYLSDCFNFVNISDFLSLTT